VYPPPGLKPIRQVFLDRLFRDFRQSDFSECRPEELQRIHVLLVIAFAPEWRFGTPLDKPVGPVIESEPFAGKDRRQIPVVPRIEAVPKEPLRLAAIRGTSRFPYDFSFLVLVADLPKL
jgi:hypothetical protein